MTAKKKAPAKEPEVTVVSTLTEAQARKVAQILMQKSAAENRVAELQGHLDDVLSMVKPDGANGFDPATMSFISVPPTPPKLED